MREGVEGGAGAGILGGNPRPCAFGLAVFKPSERVGDLDAKENIDYIAGR